MRISNDELHISRIYYLNIIEGGVLVFAVYICFFVWRMLLVVVRLLPFLLFRFGVCNYLLVILVNFKINVPFFYCRNTTIKLVSFYERN